MPADVRAFVARRMSCNHRAGEEAYDAARGREIALVRAAERCDAPTRNEQRLCRLHVRDRRVLALPARSRDWIE